MATVVERTSLSIHQPPFEDFMKLRLLSAVFVTTAILGATSITAGASSTTPYQQMRQVVADADAKLGVRVTTTASMSGMKIVQVTDAGRSTGRQTITLSQPGKSNTLLAELIKGALYVKGDDAILTAYLGLTQSSANELADQWFGIPKSSGYYAEVAQGLTISTGMAEVTMTPSVTSAPAAILDGVKVDVLKGTSVKSSLEPSFKETLYLSTAKKPLPVEVTQSVQGSLGTVTFSHWNEKIVLVAPKITLHLN
jgi:hypothetical protein